MHSDTNDIWWNLSMEEYLLGKVSTDHCILFIYQNRDSVVIGRNQNPWIECRIDLLKQDNLILARRISGGGAVFHDMGNLNFTFLVSKNDYNFKKQINVILLALKELGVIAVLNDKNDLVFNNKKISGNAFSYKRNCVLHHGTLLINSNLSKLSMVLKPLANSIKTRSVKSKPSEVININEINPAITIESVKDTVTNIFKEIYGENTPIKQ
ncbi:MAG: lipoate--protein ligase, partial [Spirochaetota bacterium]|nr:lipoate--protein ligase [Spirochaetota bacterium]